MSLHRVASIENWEQRPSRGSSPAAVEHRKMSFNPVSNLIPDTADKNPIAALEVSQAKRIAQVALACIYCLLGAGVVFGYAAFKPVLVKEGVYGELCEEPGDGYKTCYNQELRMFTSAAVVTNVVALPVGTILDRFGPRVCGVLGSLFLTIGCIFMVVAPRAPFDAYLPSYLFLALGGPFIFISSFQLSNCFPRFDVPMYPKVAARIDQTRHSGLILALLTGAFDTSSAVLLLYRLIYNATDGTFTPQKFFTVYLVVPIFILLVQIFVMPSQSYQTVGGIINAAENSVEDGTFRDDNGVHSGRQSLTGDHSKVIGHGEPSEVSPLLNKKDSERAQELDDRKKRISRVWGVLHGLSAYQQILTPWWILIALFVMVQMLRINYFVATIRSQYYYMFRDYARAVRVNSVFDVALPAGGVISVPCIGLILDNLSTPVTLALLVSIATTIGILGLLPYEPAAYLNIVLFVLYRPFYYTAVSDYAAKVFGFHTFGKVYGLIICISGLFNFIQSALDAVTHKTYNGDPAPANLVLLLVALVVGLTLVGYVFRKSTTMQRDLLEGEAEEAEDAPMPDVGLEDEHTRGHRRIGNTAQQT